MRHMKQVARTSAATPYPRLPLPTAATVKTILFFCFPHLKKGLQPNCRPWPCFIFPTCILLTPFSYGTYGACHQMRRRHILQFWWKEQQLSNGKHYEQFLEQIYLSCGSEFHLGKWAPCIGDRNAFKLCKSINWKTSINKPIISCTFKPFLQGGRNHFRLEDNQRELKEYALLWWWNFYSSIWQFMRLN